MNIDLDTKQLELIIQELTTASKQSIEHRDLRRFLKKKLVSKTAGALELEFYQSVSKVRSAITCYRDFSKYNENLDRMANIFAAFARYIKNEREDLEVDE